MVLACCAACDHGRGGSAFGLFHSLCVKTSARDGWFFNLITDCVGSQFNSPRSAMRFPNYWKCYPFGFFHCYPTCRVRTDLHDNHRFVYNGRKLWTAIAKGMKKLLQFCNTNGQNTNSDNVGISVFGFWANPKVMVATSSLWLGIPHRPRHPLQF